MYSHLVHYACHYSNTKPPVAQMEEHGTITDYLAIPRLLVRPQFGGIPFSYCRHERVIDSDVDIIKVAC
jgi:hypothetical protein